MTGTGKTYTIFGNRVKNLRISRKRGYVKGIIDHLIEELFK